MGKETKEPKTCILIFKELFKTALGDSQNVIENKKFYAKTHSKCLGKECQWWWLCSGKIYTTIFNSLEAIHLQLTEIWEKIDAKK